MTTPTKTAHTPGPWRITHSAQVATPNCKQTICCEGSGYTKEENEANARLIAAAPELLEALESAYEKIECYDARSHNAGTCLCKRAHAAINKARGL